MKQSISVLGDGAWGTAFATVLAANGHPVTLWCFDPRAAGSITKTHENTVFLPGVKLSELITPTTDCAQACASDIIFQAIPVKFLRSALTKCAPHVTEKQLWVSLSKGIEDVTLMLPTDIMRQVLGAHVTTAVVSGPSFAIDVARQQPTIVTIAATTDAVQKTLAQLLTNSYFSCIPTSDLLGAQLGGALKNIFALGTGVLTGAGYGNNTQVLLVLKGLREMATLMDAMGGNPATLYGPSGIGDMMLTCFGKQSRNNQVGLLIGQGKKLADVLAATQATAEGVNTLQSIWSLAQKYHVPLPVSNALHQVVWKGEPVSALIESLRG
jgi:glycerol-3-phosphate dehydrogenase (NAD(P)+)